MAFLVPVAVFLAVAAVGYAIAGTVQRRRSLRESLHQLSHYSEVRTSPDDHLSEPLTHRLLLPVASRAARLGRAFTPAGYLDRVRQRLVLAGKGDPEAVDRILALQVVSLVAGAVMAIVVGSAMPVPTSLRFGVTGFIALAGALAPKAVVDRAAEQRQRGIASELADAIDLLALSIEAGAGIDQALHRVAADVSGPLGEELRRLHGDMRAGASRAVAMRALVSRTDVPEVRSFVMAVLQSEALGIPIAPALRAQSEETRVRRRQLLQERAQKAPVKMLVPMVFCIFPALFVVVIGPAVINMAGSL